MMAAAAGQRLRTGIARRCALIVIDFDETLTTNDTCSVLGRLGVHAAADGVQAAARWDGLVAQFVEEYAAKVPFLLPDPPLKCWDSIRFQQFVTELAEFDAVCNARLEAGALAGISNSALCRAAVEQVVPRPGAPAVLQQLLSGDACPGEVHVISASWSSLFVREAVRHHFVGDAAALPPVTANSLVAHRDVSTGAVEWTIPSAGNKAEWIRHWVAARRDDRSDADKDSYLKVVVGDSVGDLPAMVEAGVGVIVKESSSLMAAIESFGLDVVPLETLLASADADGGSDGDTDCLDLLVAKTATAPVLLMATGGWPQVEVLLFGQCP